MRNNRRTNAKKTKLPFVLLSLAILLVAGFGFGSMLTHMSPQSPGATPSALAEAEVSASPSVLEPTPSNTPVALPTATPAASKRPRPLMTLIPRASAPVIYDEETGELTIAGATAQPALTPVPSTVPSGPLGGLKIGIDAGHQQKMNSEKELVKPGGKEKKPKVASGTTGVRTKIPEYKTTLRMSLILKDTLECLGAEVLMTRETNDVNISNIERAEMMNEWGADLVLRIHCNGVDSRSKNGIGLYVTKTGPIAKDSYAAAQSILPAMVSATGARKDGIFKRDIYSGLNWSTVPSILVETGFMSNPDVDEKLNDPAYQQLLANGMAQGVADYFGRELPEGWSEMNAESAHTPAGAGDGSGGAADESGPMG